MDISSILSNSAYNLYSATQTQKSTPPSMEEMTQRLIEDKDKDGSGTLDAAELCISEDLLKQLDSDGDGQLNSEELIAGAEQLREAMGPPPEMPALMASEEDESDIVNKTLLDYIDQDDDDNKQNIFDLIA